MDIRPHAVSPICSLALANEPQPAQAQHQAQQAAWAAAYEPCSKGFVFLQWEVTAIGRRY